MLRIIIGRSHYNTSSDAQLYAPYPFFTLFCPNPGYALQVVDYLFSDVLLTCFGGLPL